MWFLLGFVMAFWQGFTVYYPRRNYIEGSGQASGWECFCALRGDVIAEAAGLGFI